MKLKMIMLVFLSIFVACGVANADSYESFDDPADFQPEAGDPPWTLPGGTFFPDCGIDDIGSDFGDGKTFSAWHIDRPGHGKAFKVHSDDPAREIKPMLFEVPGPMGVRWKFDLWIGPRTGTFKHDALSLKFAYMGPATCHTIYLAECGPTDSALRYTNLSTGAEGDAPDLPLASPNLYLRVTDCTTWNKNIMYTDLHPLRETWITLEFEIVCGNPAHVKIWLNGSLDFYRIFNGQDFHNCHGVACFCNFSDSAGGDLYLGVDEFYKYDSPKPDGDSTPPEPPSNPEIVRK